MSVALSSRPKPIPKKAAAAVPVLEADQTLARLAEEFALDPQEAVAVITHQGKPALAVLSMEYFESLLETLEVMGDENAMAAIRASRNDIANDRTYDWEEVKQRLNL